MKKQEENKVVWNGMPTEVNALKEIKAAVDATYPCFQAMENEKGNIKDIFDELHEKYGIPKRLFNFLAKVNYKGNGIEEMAKNEEIKEAYDKLQEVDLV